MAHGYEDSGLAAETAHPREPTTLLGRIMHEINRAVVVLSSIALVLSALVLTYSVVTRYFLHISTYWQDELSVFLIVGAVFMSAAEVQARRGHVAIEAVAVLLPRRLDRVRLAFVDAAGAAFCGYFAWKSWTLLHEAWVDDYHSSSTWAPPLWIPYSLMAVGMTLLTVQILLQLAYAFRKDAEAHS